MEEFILIRMFLYLNQSLICWQKVEVLLWLLKTIVESIMESSWHKDALHFYWIGIEITRPLIPNDGMNTP